MAIPWDDILAETVVARGPNQMGQRGEADRLSRVLQKPLQLEH